MADIESRPLAEVLFGSACAVPAKSETELAEAISAWFCAVRVRVRDGANFGMADAAESNASRRQS